MWISYSLLMRDRAAFGKRYKTLKTGRVDALDSIPPATILADYQERNPTWEVIGIEPW